MKRLDLVMEGAIGAATIAATAGRKCRMERAKPPDPKRDSASIRVEWRLVD
jgi:hypothetical protein